MTDFLNKLKSGEVFLYEVPQQYHIRTFSISDDEIDDVRHVYAARWIKIGQHDKEFDYCGILIGDTLYNAEYFFSQNSKLLGINIATLDDVKNTLKESISCHATQIIYQRAHELAKEAIALAKKDAFAMKSNPNHVPSANKDILEYIIYKTNDHYYPRGKALRAFYNGGLDDQQFSKLVKVDVSKKDVLRYLSAADSKVIYDELAEKAVTEAKDDVETSGNYIVIKIAERIITEEYYRSLKSNKQGVHNLIKKINDAVHSLNAKTVSVTINICDELFTFSIGTGCFRHENTLNEYAISPAKAKREVMEKLKSRCKLLDNWNKNHIVMDDIVEIKYKNKIVYEK